MVTAVGSAENAGGKEASRLERSLGGSCAGTAACTCIRPFRQSREGEKKKRSGELGQKKDRGMEGYMRSIYGLRSILKSMEMRREDNIELDMVRM